MAVLSAGQLSKNLLLFRLVFERLPAKLRRRGTMVSDAIALLERARNRRPATVDQLFGYPYLAAGLVNCLRGLEADGQPDQPVALLAAIAMTAAVRAGCDGDLDGVPAITPLHLPTLGSARTDADGTLRLARRSGRLTIGSILVPEETDHDIDGWIGVRTLVPATGEWAAPLLDDVDPHRGAGSAPVAPRTSPARLVEWRAMFADAIQLLRERHPRRAAQVDGVLRTLTPLETHRPGQGRSASAWQAYGAVATTMPGDALSLAATLVHETQHSVLNGLHDLVDLYDKSDRRLYYSPWRADPRPLRGLLHGCYAFLGILDFWARERAAGPASRPAEFEFARSRRQVRHALNTLRDVPSLTTDGRYLVTQMAQYAATLDSVPPVEPAEHLASLAHDDHRLSWRLRVAVPDPAVVAVAAQAWRAGRPTPPLSESRLAGAADTFVPNERARRFALAARQEQVSGCDPADVDERLVRRDYRAAADGYRDAVRAGADNVSVWTGLALAGVRLRGPGARVWQRRPEFVRALYRELAPPVGPPPDPLSLAGWLAGGLPD
jgi:HEXXH motif-containing protein